MLSKPSVLDLNTHPSSFGSSRIAARFEPPVFAELKIEDYGRPPMPSPDRH
jgi:hypothetical protein